MTPCPPQGNTRFFAIPVSTQYQPSPHHFNLKSLSSDQQEIKGGAPVSGPLDSYPPFCASSFSFLLSPVPVLLSSIFGAIHWSFSFLLLLVLYMFLGQIRIETSYHTLRTAFVAQCDLYVMVHFPMSITSWYNLVGLAVLTQFS